jgi:hypothetical protein
MVVDNVMHEILSSPTEATVYGCSRASQEGPGIIVVFWQVGVSVMEVRDGNDPVVHPHIWNYI